MRPKNQIGVDCVDAIEAFRRVTTAKKHPHTGTIQDIAFNAHHAEPGGGHKPGQRGIHFLCPHIQEAHSKPSSPPTQTSSPANRNDFAALRKADATAVKKARRLSERVIVYARSNFEITQAFQEKLSLFTKEQREAVQINSLIVHIGLGKICVPGQLGCQAGS